MAYNKAEKSDSPVRRKGGIRRRKSLCILRKRQCDRLQGCQ